MEQPITTKNVGQPCVICGQAADAQATIAALQVRVEAHERAYQEGHPTPCTLGSYCPYCEIERRVAQLTQRTAELEAVKAELEQERVRLAGCLIAAEGGTKDIVKQGDYGWSPAYQATLNLHAELERVRGELVEATHNANVYQSLYSTGCMDRALLENELRDIRTLILALPKVEGEITELTACLAVRGGRVTYAMIAALLQHRQGMEGV